MTQVVVVGAGPAGATLAWLMGRAGVAVTLVERGRDFSREFRGEILMPSGQQALREMGLSDLLTSTPTVRFEQFRFYLNRRSMFSVDLTQALGDRQPVAISQPAFLEAVIERAVATGNVEFLPGAVPEALLRESGRVAGVRLRGNAGRDLPADLVVGADGRNSMVRRGLPVPAQQLNQPMDVVWCKMPLPGSWRGIHAFAGRGHLAFAYPSWDGSLQVAWVILKGTFRQLRGAGIDAWVREMANHVSAELADHLISHIDDISRPFLLEVISDRAARWSAPGALLVGDAAHTMSPVGGQGINIALRDVIVACNHLIPVLRHSEVGAIDAAALAFESERLPELTFIQRMQSLPPRLMLNGSWWGEVLRQMIAIPIRSTRVRARMAGRVVPFLDGVTDVRLADPGELNQS